MGPPSRSSLVEPFPPGSCSPSFGNPSRGSVSLGLLPRARLFGTANALLPCRRPRANQGPGRCFPGACRPQDASLTHYIPQKSRSAADQGVWTDPRKSYSRTEPLLWRNIFLAKGKILQRARFCCAEILPQIIGWWI